MNAIYIKTYYFFSLLLKRFLTLAEVFLLLRLILKFFGASSKAFIVKYFYQFTDVIVWPFQNIFPNFHLGDNLIEMVVISAMVGYAIAVFVVLKILKLLARQ